MNRQAQPPLTILIQVHPAFLLLPQAALNSHRLLLDRSLNATLVLVFDLFR